MKYASMEAKPARVEVGGKLVGVLLTGDDKLLGAALSKAEKRDFAPVRRVFFLDGNGVHECSRASGLSIEETLKSAVLVDCNTLHLAAALAELGEKEPKAVVVQLEAVAEEARAAAEKAYEEARAAEEKAEEEAELAKAKS